MEALEPTPVEPIQPVTPVEPPTPVEPVDPPTPPTPVEPVEPVIPSGLAGGHSQPRAPTADEKELLETDTLRISI